MVAKALSAGDLKIYLPQKEVVLLEWWFDFMVNKKNSSARCNPDYWKLLAEGWTRLQDDPETLSRIYLSHNFLGILSDTLSDLIKISPGEFSEEKVQVLILSIASAIKTLGTSSLWFRVSSDTANAIIFSFLKTIEYLNLNFPNLLHDNSTLLLTTEVFNVIQATLYGTSELKKMSASFNPKCLGIAFLTLGYDLPEEIHSAIKSAVLVLICEKEQDTTDIDFKLISPEKLGLQNVNQNSEILQSVLHFYSIICVKTPKKAPQAFFNLTQLYPVCVKQLIKVAGEYQIKISAEFLNALVDKALENIRTVNWELMELILELDSTVLTEEHRSIKILSIKSNSTSEFTSFAKALIKYYAEARELTSFMMSWKSHIANNSPWYTDEVLQHLAIHIKSLSTHQMKSLLSFLVKPLKAHKIKESAAQLYTPIIPVVMSFFLQQSPPATVLYEFLFDILNSTHNSDSELFWHSKYLILSLNAVVVQRSAETILKQAKEIKYGLEKEGTDTLVLQVMQIIFRIREIVPVEKFDSICKKILKHIGKKAKDPELFLQVINNRWLLVANSCFDQENRDRLIGLFMQYDQCFQGLCQNEVFYEQTNLSRIVVTEIASEIDKKQAVDLARSKLLSTLPMEIVRRDNRVKILTMLASTTFDESSLQHQIYIRTAIVRFLEHPTVSTDFETKPAILRNYFTALSKIDNDPLETATRRACDRVILYHAANYKTQELSANFLKGLIDHELDFLNKLKPNKSLSSSKQKALDFSCVVATSAPTDMMVSTGLGESLIKVLLNQLENSKASISESSQQSLLILRNLDHLSAMTSALSELTSLHSLLGGYVVHALKDLKESEPGLHSQQILIHCFQILVRTSVSSVEIEVVVALFTVLCEYDIQVEESILLSKLAQLEDAEFTNMFSLVVSDTFAESLSPFSYFKTATVFASAADMKLHPSCVEHIIRLIACTVSNSESLDAKSFLVFLDFLDLLLKDKTWIITQYALELVIAAITRLSIDGPELEVEGDQDEVFTAVTRVLSSVLLFHRHRLNSRYFLLTKVFSALLTALAIPRHSMSSTRFSRIPKSLSVACEHQITEKSAVAYSRLLENLCEPPIQSIRERGGRSNLTSASTVAKRQVSKFIGILLINYIRLTLQTGFSGPIKKGLTPGFYLVFDILGEEKLRNANYLLDANSRPYFKTLYEDYMSHGKWKND